MGALTFKPNERRRASVSHELMRQEAVSFLMCEKVGRSASCFCAAVSDVLSVLAAEGNFLTILESERTYNVLEKPSGDGRLVEQIRHLQASVWANQDVLSLCDLLS